MIKNQRLRKKNCILLLVSAICIILSAFTFIKTGSSYNFVSKKIHIRGEKNKIKLITLDESPIPENPIWMVETRHDHVHFSPLELCAIESVAKYHTNTRVIMTLVSRYVAKSDRVEKLLQTYPNLELRHVSLDSLFSENSPIHSLWTSGRVQNSMWPISHTSDIVRFMLLYKYGGTWLDTDVIRKLHEMVNGFLF